MGFLEQLAKDAEGAESDGPSYVNEAEKDDIIANSIPFTISDVAVRDNPFGDGEQYVLTVNLAGEDRLMTFTKGAGSRDRSLKGLIDSGELASGPVGPLTLGSEPTKRGRKYIVFRNV